MTAGSSETVTRAGHDRVVEYYQRRNAHLWERLMECDRALSGVRHLLGRAEEVPSWAIHEVLARDLGHELAGICASPPTRACRYAPQVIAHPDPAQ